MKENEVLRGFPKHLEKVEKIKLGKDLIDYFMLNLPPLCNYNCKKCFTKASSRTIEHTLNLDEIISLIDEAKDMGAKLVGITGEGEPLANNSIKEVIMYINQKRMIPLIATNGSLLTKETVQFLADQNATVTISLDTLDENIYNDLCGVRNGFRTVMQNIDSAREVYKDKIKRIGGYKVMNLAIHTIITSENINQIVKIKNLCGEDILFSCDYVAEIGEALKNRNLIKEKDKETIKTLATQSSEKIVLTNTDNREVCGLFYFGLAVGAGGDVLIDAHAIDSDGLLGNVRETPLRELVISTNKQKERFYREFGDCYCIIRDTKYKNFLRSLK